MRSLFGRGLQFTGGDLQTTFKIIRHLQKGLAYQQLSMEINNDATAAVFGAPLRTSELSHQEFAGDATPQSVRDVLLPAIDEKLKCLELMSAEFDLAARAVSAGSVTSRTGQTLRSVCADFAGSARTSKARADVQRNSFRTFVERPDLPQPDPSALDGAEATATTKALMGLQSVLERAGVDLDALTAINHEVGNEIRTSRQQTPLTLDDYRARYFIGITGGHARFFDD